MQRPSFYALTFALAVPAAAWSADYTVERTLEISSSAEEAWHVIGDFCDIDDWHPALASCTLKVIDGSLHRILVATDGGEFVEKRIAEEPGLSYTYQIISSPFPLDKSTSTLSITRGDPSTLSWSSRFASDDAGMEQAVVDFYDAGLSAIAERLPN